MPYPLAPSLAEDTDQLRRRFSSARPFRHLLLDDFFEPEFVGRLLNEFPPFGRGNALDEQGKLGGKSVVEKIRELGPAHAAVDDLIQSDGFLGWLSAATGIPGLRYDPWYFGGGTHDNRHGQSLDPHVDFNRHPETGSHRRLNLILYLNPEWQDAWGGSLELHSDPRSEHNEIIRIAPTLNRCVVFETTERSWHGFSRVELPESRQGLSRKSLALYFYTDDRPCEELAPRHSTVYVDRPLSARFAPGLTLSESDVEEIRVHLARRDQHIQRLYGDLTRSEQRFDDVNRSLWSVFRQACVGIYGYAKSTRTGNDRSELQAAIRPLASRAPSPVFRVARAIWRAVVTKPAH